ncbi:Trk system potassium transporter TrkA [Niveispirillum cyanobacteriorum]|uniref:Trk system potassium uptake protein TrkA n=1 Tax=Niveispirillum cyanobacteriorum TaxID=1612173 RepID=A0A2K9N921_9PROT|nr:Trk system potassium transporter TrkA [Niveispirillum cyanobacteriorum]AUN29584.1 Trk system potassium transporter TrkA [Niveispirillum cyanobacteriorum]GGE62917.1 Trk system potassium transport protein TrkA [Niveispirillum cyanobacteriorum]
MKVIVCGAGQVGSNIARYLASEGNHVTVIDQSPELIQKISDTLDVQAMVGFASHPNVLEAAGAADADMLIAVTLADEVNMVACQVAASLFNVPTKIARVRHQSYLQPIWRDLFSREHLPIDVIISPEIEVARAVSRRLQVPGAFDMIPLADGLVKVIGVVCTDNCPIINTPLRQLTGLFPDLAIEVVAIIRGDQQFIPGGNDQMLPGDEVYFVADTNHVTRAMAAFGHEERQARRVIIVGGGNIGLCLAEEIEQNQPSVSARIIEVDRRRATHVAQKLKRTMVLHGDALDPAILEEANVGASETVVAVSNSDEGNILASLLAKRHGCKRAITLINKTTYQPLVLPLGIDAVVSPRSITVSSILQHVRRGRIKAVHSLRENFAEVIEAEALETSTLINTPLKDIRLPAGIIVGAIVRAGKVIIPRPSTVIKPNDRVIILAEVGQVKKVEKMFAVRLEFF